MRMHTYTERKGWCRRGIRLCMYLLVMLALASCSTKKNTSATRFFHATTARFNTLYNGQVAYKEGREAQLKGHVEDYTQMLPMYICTNKKTAELGKGT